MIVNYYLQDYVEVMFCILKFDCIFIYYVQLYYYLTFRNPFMLETGLLLRFFL